MSLKQNWNAELYEGRHSFVWELGRGILELLHPEKGEKILDLGCGTGQLTQQIADSGARVTGLDASPDMIGQARQNYPNLDFVLADATAMHFEGEFDAVFSNAALHWMMEPAKVIAAMARALRPGGRLVAEFGGKGNIQRITEALEKILPKYYGNQELPSPNFFPSISTYGTLLEAHGFEVRLAQLFDRPTPLDGGEKGMENWLLQFRAFTFDAIPVGHREQALREVVEELRNSLQKDGQWSADYRRLRVIAVRL